MNKLNKTLVSELMKLTTDITKTVDMFTNKGMSTEEFVHIVEFNDEGTRPIDTYAETNGSDSVLVQLFPEALRYSHNHYDCVDVTSYSLTDASEIWYVDSNDTRIYTKEKFDTAYREEFSTKSEKDDTIEIYSEIMMDKFGSSVHHKSMNDELVVIENRVDTMKTDTYLKKTIVYSFIEIDPLTVEQLTSIGLQNRDEYLSNDKSLFIRDCHNDDLLKLSIFRKDGTRTLILQLEFNVIDEKSIECIDVNYSLIEEKVSVIRASNNGESFIISVDDITKMTEDPKIPSIHDDEVIDLLIRAISRGFGRFSIRFAKNEILKKYVSREITTDGDSYYLDFIEESKHDNCDDHIPNVINIAKMFDTVSLTDIINEKVMTYKQMELVRFYSPSFIYSKVYSRPCICLETIGLGSVYNNIYTRIKGNKLLKKVNKLPVNDEDVDAIINIERSKRYGYTKINRVVEFDNVKIDEDTLDKCGIVDTITYDIDDDYLGSIKLTMYPMVDQRTTAHVKVFYSSTDSIFSRNAAIDILFTDEKEVIITKIDMDTIDASPLASVLITRELHESDVRYVMVSKEDYEK